MPKIAVFVEGQTELIVTREFLLRKHNWVLNIKCYDLFKENYSPADYDYSSPDYTYSYMVVNIGGDERVLSSIIKREQSLINNGYDKVVGLRDMYSKEYRSFSHVIDNQLNERFISVAEDAKRTNTKNPDKIEICFSIMEVEAWFLGLFEVLAKIHEKLNGDSIKKELNIDLAKINPETEFFHPATVLGKIYAICGHKYDKKASDVAAICSKLDIEEYIRLYNSQKCNSFNKFHDALL